MFKPEITVASVIEKDGRFLMVEEETEHGITLNQPAGHLEAVQQMLSSLPDNPMTGAVSAIRRTSSIPA